MNPEYITLPLSFIFGFYAGWRGGQFMLGFWLGCVMFVANSLIRMVMSVP